jgi:HlyD family secretion protein
MTRARACLFGGMVMLAAGCSQPSVTAEQNAASPAPVLAAPGRVEGQSEVVEVGAAVDGVIAAVLVDEGQAVKAGELIARLACDDLEAEIGAAKAAENAARQAKARLVRGSRDEERHVAAADEAAARAALGEAQDQFKRQSALIAEGIVPQDQFDRASRQLDAAKAAQAAAVARERLVNAGPLPEEIQRADAEITLADRRAATAQARFAKCFVRSPIDGTVLKRHREPGESISVFVPRPIVSVANVSARRIRAEVDERDIARVREGQRARVTIDAFPDHPFSGTVRRIGSLMGRKTVRAGDPAEKADRDVLEVLIDIDQPDPKLVIGLRVTVSFLE